MTVEHHLINRRALNSSRPQTKYSLKLSFLRGEGFPSPQVSEPYSKSRFFSIADLTTAINLSLPFSSNIPGSIKSPRTTSILPGIRPREPLGSTKRLPFTVTGSMGIPDLMAINAPPLWNLWRRPSVLLVPSGKMTTDAPSLIFLPAASRLKKMSLRFLLLIYTCPSRPSA